MVLNENIQDVNLANIDIYKTSQFARLVIRFRFSPVKHNH